jgi:L-ascorbate metabolism protein UlaG (beta-lactamase superfamily)
MTLQIRRFGGPTTTFSYGGLVFVTDPTFDEPGEYRTGPSVLTKIAPPAFPAPAGADVVLLSHDQHADNLDTSGREFCATVPLVLSTPAAAENLKAKGLEPWQTHETSGVTITAVPAQHGPDGTEHLTGPVTGFVLQKEGLDSVYVSGDNASLQVVKQIAARFPDLDVAILFGGAARVPGMGAVNLTLDAAGMLEAARILGVTTVVPVHVDSWAHFTEDLDAVRAAFAGTDLLLIP